MRTFIGVPVDHHLALALVEQRELAAQRLGTRGLRPVAARNLHLTLAFLGEIDASQMAALRRHLPDMAHGHAPFDQPLTRCGQFPERNGRILAAEGSAVIPLRTLWNSVKQGLADIIVADISQSLRPHITLARLAAVPMMALDWPVTLALRVEELVLFESRPGAGGSEYRRLASAGLASAPS